MSQTLISSSVMLIGERTKSKLVWIQLYDASHSIKEEELSLLLREVKTHILRGRIKQGSARKFLDGKLVYFEVRDKVSIDRPDKIYCLFTHEMDIGAMIKHSIQAVAQRGGGYSVYSASRFFSEMIDLVSNPGKLSKWTIQMELSLEDIMNRIDNYYSEAYDVNELGQIISFLTKSAKLDWNTLETIYLHVYESIQSLTNNQIETDPDEFLDAAYIVARRYQQIDKYRLGLELFKLIIPVASNNKRFDLEIACLIRICTIYKNNFPEPGEYILDALSLIKNAHLREAAKTHREIYYCLLGFAYDQLNDRKQSLKYYNRAIHEAGVNISSPSWIAEAYDYIARDAIRNFFLMEGARYYLTAATLAFSGGHLTKADSCRNKAAEVEIQTSYSLVQAAHIYRMEGNLKDAEYRAWDALRYLIRAFTHSQSQTYNNLLEQSLNILNEVEIILCIKGKLRKNRTMIRKIRKSLTGIISGEINSAKIKNSLDDLVDIIEMNIPIKPPTFMLLTLDGRLILMGKIVDNEWLESEIKGVILGGILTAIMSLITEVTGKTSLRTVDAGSLQIIIEHSENVAVVLLLDRDIPEFRQKLVNILDYIDNTHAQKIKYWTGKRAIFEFLKREIINRLGSLS